MAVYAMHATTPDYTLRMGAEVANITKLISRHVHNLRKDAKGGLCRYSLSSYEAHITRWQL